MNTQRKENNTSASANAQPPITMHTRKNLTPEERVDLLIYYIKQNEGMRKENRLTYTDIAKKLGVSTAAIYNTKNGLLTKAAKKMGVSRDSLLEHPHKAHQVPIYSVREVDKRKNFSKEVPEDTTPEQMIKTTQSIIQTEEAEVAELAAKGISAYMEMLKQFETAEQAFAAFEQAGNDLQTAMKELSRFTDALKNSRVGMNVAADFAKQVEDHAKYIAKKQKLIEELKAQCCKGYTIDAACQNEFYKMVSEDAISEEKRTEIMSRIVFNQETSGYSEEFCEKAMELQPADFKKLILIIGVSEKESAVEWKFSEETLLTELLKIGGFNVTISKQSQS